MLDFRERLSEIAAKKQKPDKLEPYTLHKMDLKKVAVEFLENLLDYFECLSSDAILEEREIEIEISNILPPYQIRAVDNTSYRGITSKRIGNEWEVKFVYDYIIKKLEAAGYSIKEEKYDTIIIKKRFFVKIKP